MTSSDSRQQWPASLRPGALRWARSSGRYEATVAFYRDLLRLPIVDQFTSSFGEDGTIFGLPDTSVQLEIVRADEGMPAGRGSGPARPLSGRRPGSGEGDRAVASRRPVGCGRSAPVLGG